MPIPRNWPAPPGVYQQDPMGGRRALGLNFPRAPMGGGGNGNMLPAIQGSQVGGTAPAGFQSSATAAGAGGPSQEGPPQYWTTTAGGYQSPPAQTWATPGGFMSSLPQEAPPKQMYGRQGPAQRPAPPTNPAGILTGGLRALGDGGQLGSIMSRLSAQFPGLASFLANRTQQGAGPGWSMPSQLRPTTPAFSTPMWGGNENTSQWGGWAGGNAAGGFTPGGGNGNTLPTVQGSWVDPNASNASGTGGSASSGHIPGSYTGGGYAAPEGYSWNDSYQGWEPNR